MAASSPMAVRTMTSGEWSVKVMESKFWGQLTGVLAILSEELIDLVTNLTLGNLDVVLGGTIVGHEGEETVISNVELECAFSRAQWLGNAWTYELVLLATDVGD